MKMTGNSRVVLFSGLNKLVFCLVLYLLLTGPAMGSGLRVLKGHVPAAVSRLSPLGSLAATNRLRLAIGVPLHDPAGLEQFLKDVYTPGNPLFHHFLTPDEFTARFGPTAQDYQAVKNFALTNGLEINAEPGGRLLLDVSGRVPGIENAFHVKLKRFQHPTEPREFFAPDTEPSVDAALPVVDIQGMSNYGLPRPKLHPMIAVKGAVKNGTAPDGSAEYFGDDFRKAYVPGTPLTGAGQMVGLFQDDGYYDNDIAAYARQAGGGRTNIIIQKVLLDGYNGVPYNAAANTEVSLDIEMAMAMAPGLARIIVFEGNPQEYLPNDILSAMSSSNMVKNLSCSWGWGGGPSITTDVIFQKMAAQGQSFFNASGDSDAFTSGASSVNGVDNPALANAPSSDPYITQVGGTTLTMNGTGASYGSETVWNYGYVATRGAYVGSSGGVSSYYAIPSWQAAIGNLGARGGSTVYRNTPDVALTGDNVYITYGGYGASMGEAGTSCAAPLWAGFMALVNQQAAANGNPSVGFINPAIYAIATNSSYASCFHDITTGNNATSDSPGAFYATAGYDLCTGLGTPTVNLINALAQQSVLGLPDLAPFQPSGWSDKLVVTAVPGAITNSPAYYSTNTLYVDFAVANYGTVPTPTGFNCAIYVDGVLTNTIAEGVLTNGIYQPATGYAIGKLAAGSHTITVVADSGNVITEITKTNNSYSRTITVVDPPLPNLAFYQPSGWSDKVVVTAVYGAITDSPVFYSTNTLYVDFAMANYGTAPTPTGFNCAIYVDGVLNTTIPAGTIDVGYYNSWSGYSVGNLAAGSHTITVVADSGNVITETSKTDNTYSRTITVADPPLPNLAFYQPSGWSDKLVVTAVPGAITNSPAYYSTNTLYVDFAVLNYGTAPTPTGSNCAIYVDGVLTNTIADGVLTNGYYQPATGYAIGKLTAGSHTITVVADSGNVITETNKTDNTYSRTITVVDPLLPSLAFYQPSGWSDKLVVTAVPGAITNSPAYYSTNTLYVDFAVVNYGTAPTPTGFNCGIYVDGVLSNSIPATVLTNGYFDAWTGYSIGKLSAGTHTISVVADTGKVITETNKADNTYTITVTVAGPPAMAPGTPYFTTPRFGAGQFQVVLNGAVGSNYVVYVSTNLLNWTTLKTLTLINNSTNLADSSAGAPRRFYRAALNP